VLNEWDEGNNACSLRILLGPDGRDRGLGTEAVRLITGYAFDRLRLHRVALEVYAFNPRARRAYEKAGFVTEGVLRDALRWDDGWVDAVVMSVLAPEWARHHGRPAGR
jgi:RimJ/RimL family protein N-acetyltransferase